MVWIEFNSFRPWTGRIQRRNIVHINGFTSCYIRLKLHVACQFSWTSQLSPGNQIEIKNSVWIIRYDVRIKKLKNEFYNLWWNSTQVPWWRWKSLLKLISLAQNCKIREWRIEVWLILISYKSWWSSKTVAICGSDDDQRSIII